MAESFNATIKKELIHLHTWPTLSKVKKEVFHYIEVYYNRKRPHSRIGNLAPCEAEHNWCQEFDKELRAWDNYSVYESDRLPLLHAR